MRRTSWAAYNSWVDHLRRGLTRAYTREKFFESIVKTHEHPSCWTWKGRFKHGLPVAIPKRNRIVSAASYSAEIHGLPKGKYFSVCGNQKCVHPAHLNRREIVGSVFERGHTVTETYTRNAHIAGNLAYHRTEIVRILGGSTSLLWRWRKNNPGLLHTTVGNIHGKH